MDADVIIVGAGPAGSTCARLCAAAGLETLLVDRAAFPRDKPCAGGLSPRAAADLARLFGLASDGGRPGAPPGTLPEAFGVPRASLRALHYTRSTGYRRLRVDAPGPLLHVTRRSLLDDFLLREAERAGARVLTRTEVVAWGQDEAGVSVVTRETPAGRSHESRAAVPPGSGAARRGPVLLRPLRARFLVGADGAASTVARGVAQGPARAAAARRRAGPGAVVPRRGEAWPAARCLSLYLPLAEDDAAAVTRGCLDFHFGLVRGGYGWAFPGRAGLAVGVGALRPRGAAGPARAELEAALRRILELYGLDGHLAEARSGEGVSPAAWLVPLGGRPGPWSQGRVLLVGDAAGLADPLTGEGIGPAVSSAEAAARAVVTWAGVPVTAPRTLWPARLAVGKPRPVEAGRSWPVEGPGRVRWAAAFGLGGRPGRAAGGVAGVLARRPEARPAVPRAEFGRAIWHDIASRQRPGLLAVRLLARLRPEGQARLFRRATFDRLARMMSRQG